MKQEQKIKALQNRLQSRGINLDYEQVAKLRRCEMTLHRWCEQECGDSNNFASWSIERDDNTGKPYRVIHWHKDGKTRKYKIADRENGALKSIRIICEKMGLDWYYQTDPRGCALYITPKDMGLNDSNYSSVGVGVCD